ncbi:MAG: Cys-tRNA(Pro) deacylase [Victivallaceae bacterium]|nr:Cys-tRNA(Pro) deacylase [Victivallaceae bacterium]
MEKTNVLRLLDAAGIGFRAFEYEVADGKLDACSVAAKIEEPVEQVFKTLVTEAAGPAYFVFVIPAAAELDLKKAAKAAGVKSLAMLHQKQLLPLTGYVHGGCSPVGMKKQLPTFIDETAILFDHICVSGGKVGLNLAIEPESLAGLVNAEFADLAK